LSLAAKGNPSTLAVANSFDFRKSHQLLCFQVGHPYSMSVLLKLDIFSAFDLHIGLPYGLSLRHQCLIAFVPSA
jgi:hypothetical protein